MNVQLDVERILLAQKTVRAELLAERAQDGHWIGHVAGSPLATAAAVSALVAAHHEDTGDALREPGSEYDSEDVAERVVQGDLCEFLLQSVNWLAQHQNDDGGWGDCLDGRSNIAATLLVQAAFRLTGIPAKFDDLMRRADDYVALQGGVAALKRQSREDKSFTAAVLTNCALAGIVPWRQVPALPFEMACLPQHWQKHLRKQASRTSLPLLLAVGQARFRNDPPRNPVARLLRRSTKAKALSLLQQLQAADDSFLASVTTTSFVVLSLASIGCQDHPIVQRGIEFLLSTVRGDASWSVIPNLSTTVTSLALAGLADDRRTSHFAWDETVVANETEVSHHNRADESANCHPGADSHRAYDDESLEAECVAWLLRCQKVESSALTGVASGGWGFSDARGALPDAMNTAHALIALSRVAQNGLSVQREQLNRAAIAGINWLLDLQQDDGGWPTYYRRADGFERDESGVDTTSQALRALAAWRRIRESANKTSVGNTASVLVERIDSAVQRGWQYVESVQREEGSFVPLWFGNEWQPDDRNPVLGTAAVLLASAELQRLEWPVSQRAMRWLISAQHAGGGWGPPRAPLDYSNADKEGFRAWRANEAMARYCTVEETALAVAALLPLGGSHPPAFQAAASGLNWLVNALEQDAHRRPTVVGFYPHEIWYYERLYPLVFAAEALSQAVREAAIHRPASFAVSP